MSLILKESTALIMNLPIHRTLMDRQTPFAFSCGQCLKCCQAKRIQINPYEIARLASGFGLSTTEFIAGYTGPGGNILAWDSEDNCILLNSEGCSLHADRPLVCRLYPLGRVIHPAGEESFTEIRLEEGCLGVYSENLSISEYLDTEGVEPYLDAASRYLDVFWCLLEMLKQHADDPEKVVVASRVLQKVTDEADVHGNQWLDMDAMVADYCLKQQISFPQNIQEKVVLHLQALKVWAENITGGD